MGKYIDLSGQKFGKLTVIKRVEDHIILGYIIINLLDVGWLIQR